VPAQIVVPQHIPVVLALKDIVPSAGLIEGLAQPGARETALIADDPYQRVTNNPGKDRGMFIFRLARIGQAGQIPRLSPAT
jgi:hypothetical protein